MSKISFARGRRFELAIRKKLAQSLGQKFKVERVNETGWGYGIDIIIKDCKIDYTYPIGIQCKASGRRQDLPIGLRQARMGWPGARLHICLHRLYLQGRPTQPLRITAHTLDRPNCVYSELTWSGMIDLIKEVIDND